MSHIPDDQSGASLAERMWYLYHARDYNALKRSDMHRLDLGRPMELDPQIAETIVTNLKDIINHEINLFDTTGTIIASTDHTRIGTSHDGARLVIRTKKTISIDDEHEYKGAKHGINVPVLFNDSVVAVIGITGERSEVEPFGNVIKKMTEILIRESWDQVTRFDQRARLSSLVEQLRLRQHDPSLANYLATVLGVDLSVPRRCVVGRLVSPDSPADPSALSESPYSLCYSRFQHLKRSFFATTDNEIVMFIDKKDETGLPRLLRSLQNDCDERLQLMLVMGIGDIADTSDDYWRSYNEASKTVDWLLFSRTGTMASFDDMDYGIFLSSVPTEDAERLSRRVFGDLPDSEIDDYESLFEAYTRHNGSIVHCAEELFLHKNTLQNRLNKIATKTGYNPRDLADYAVLSVAFRLRRYARFERGGA